MCVCGTYCRPSSTCCSWSWSGRWTAERVKRRGSTSSCVSCWITRKSWRLCRDTHNAPPTSNSGPSLPSGDALHLRVLCKHHAFTSFFFFPYFCTSLLSQTYRLEVPAVPVSSQRHLKSVWTPQPSCRSFCEKTAKCVRDGKKCKICSQKKESGWGKKKKS